MFIGHCEASTDLKGCSALSLILTECPGTFVFIVHTVHVRLKFILYHNKLVSVCAHPQRKYFCYIAQLITNF